MKRDPRALLPTLLSAALLVLVASQTLNAVQRSGRLVARPKPQAFAANDPYARLERILDVEDRPPPLKDLRDPFVYIRPAVVARVEPRRTDPQMPRPVVTAIVTGQQDPRAVIRYGDRNYTVKTGDLFGEFRVVKITAQEVVLDNGRGLLVLHNPTKGR